MSNEDPCLLVVDDNEDNRDLLARRLQRQGYQTTVAASGLEALELVKKGRFDLVLLDIMMPEISGLDVLQSLRATSSVADLPIIMVTAKDGSQDIVEALRLGANDYVTKPIDFPVLFARVTSQLALKRANDENRELVRKLEARNEFIRSVFGRYVADDVVEKLLDTPRGLKLGGELRNITILFADLRGFSAVAERLPPEKVVALINNYYAVMTDVLDKHQGTINEFYGDGILAFFGAPVDCEDHARSAIACAVEMQLSMAKVNNINRQTGLPELQMGIGINTGDVVVGNIGSESRSKYGIVGSEVNHTARIESITEGRQILVAEKTILHAGDDLKISNKQTVQTKGLAQPIDVYELTGIGGEYDLYLEDSDADSA